MARPSFRRTLRIEHLEAREVLSSGGPGAQAQYMLDLLNLARTNPAAMAEQVTTNLDANVQATVDYYHINLQQVANAIASTPAQPPLAWNDQLANAAQEHSQDQANTGIQSHTGSDGSNLDTRLDRAGYTNRTSDGENAYAYSTSVDEAMEAFLIDWGVASDGHRNNILQPGVAPDGAYRDVGIGIVSTNKPDFGPLVITQDFGAQQGEKATLLGVAYYDPHHTGSYSQGSGAGNVTVEAVNTATGQSTTVQTWDQGGYQMSLDPGTYQVTALMGGQVVKSQQVTIGTVNVEVDFNLSNPWHGGTDPSAAITAAASRNSSNDSTPSGDSNSANVATSTPAPSSTVVTIPKRASFSSNHSSTSTPSSSTSSNSPTSQSSSSNSTDINVAIPPQSSDSTPPWTSGWTSWKYKKS